jgi:dCMP deaminase
VLTTGYNGFPMGTSDDPALYENRPKKLRRTVHAESNAIAVASYHGISLRGAMLFSTLPICCSCAGLIIQAGIQRVVIPEYPKLYDPIQHEYLGWDESMELFSEVGVTLDTVD